MNEVGPIVGRNNAHASGQGRSDLLQTGFDLLDHSKRGSGSQALQLVYPYTPNLQSVDRTGQGREDHVSVPVPVISRDPARSAQGAERGRELKCPEDFICYGQQGDLAPNSSE